MTHQRRAWLALAWLWAAAGAMAQEAYILYDDFQLPPIDSARWLDTERSRIVNGEALSMALREWGGTSSDFDRVGLTWGENITRAWPVTQLKVNLRVNSVEVIGCAANPASSRARARLIGSFFNTGVPTPGSLVGDVMAQIYVLRDSESTDPPGILKVEGNAFVCNASDCATSMLIGATQSLGTVAVGQSIVLQLEWDKVAKRFTFLRDNGAQSAFVNYTVSDRIAPGNSFKQLGLRTDLENCASGPRVYGAIDVRYDNVSVNAKARP
jgi:hypothetical protein